MKGLTFCFLVLVTSMTFACDEETVNGSDTLQADVLVADLPCDLATCPDQGIVVSGKCHIGLECGENEFCFAPGQPMCGICMEPVSTCESDTDCTEPDQVCDWVRSETCLCGPYMSCGPRCDAENGVPCNPDTQVCAGDGHCIPRSCSTDEDCDQPFVCITSDDGKVYTRKTCDSIDDCNCGWCVNGSCYLEPGTCSLPVP